MPFPVLALVLNFAAQALIAVAATMLINAIFPTRVTGPRLGDLGIQTSTYGTAIPLLLGQAVRIAGNVIWMSNGGKLKETVHEKNTGLFGSTVITTYTYSTDLAIALGERPNGIAGIFRVYADGKLIYDSARGPLAVDGTPQGLFPYWQGRELSEFFANIAQTIGVIFAPLPLIQEALTTHGVFKSITVYPGDFTQEPDPLMEADLGIGNVPAYRGTAYVVIEGLQVGDFGNRIPNLEFIVLPNPDETYGTAVETIVARAGIEADFSNFCDLDETLGGYAIGREVTATEALAPLTFAGYFDIVDDAGKLRAVSRRDEEIVGIISSDDLAGHAFGEDRPDPIQWERVAVTQLPREATVTFSDPERNFEPNSVTARRASGSADSNVSIEVPITLITAQARDLADRALWEAWIITQTGKTATTDRLIDIRVGRVYLFETPAGLEPCRIMSKTRGRNGVIELEIQRARAELYTPTDAPPLSAPAPPQSLNLPGPTELVLLDIPLMHDSQDGPGFYFAVVGSEEHWRGSAVMRALSISSAFTTLASAGVQSPVGNAENTLPDGPTELDGSSGTFDEDAYLDVTLRHGGLTLEPASDEEIAAGFNVAYVGALDDTTQGEIIQFGDVTLLSGDTYRLSHLKRGKRGTEFATGLHGPNETFVLLRSTQRADFGVSDLDLERLYKAVSLLLNPDDVDHQFFTNSGVGLRPYSPIDLDVSGDTGGDLILSGTRRSRLDSGALGEQAEVYCFRIMDGSMVAREIIAQEPFVTYTVAMQTTDFGGPVSDLSWRMAQVSATYGNGIFATWSGPVSGGSGSA